MARTILHVDMDAFYAAVEQRDHPELQGRPVVVGADPKAGRGRGVVSTASYEARRFGIASAMPISQAWRLCPDAVYLPVDMGRYAEASRRVMEILRRFSDLVEPLSIDEAFLDVTGSRRLFGPGPTLARQLKDAVRADTGLTASVGVAPSKLVAKIASDLRKPDGLVVVEPDQVEAFLAPLPVRRLWGVGPKLAQRLEAAGIRSVGDLARLGAERLEHRLGVHGHDLVRLARGLDDRAVVADRHEAKSVGQERTYDEDTDDPVRLRRTLLALCDGVARRLRDAGLRGRTVTLKYRDESFRTQTRAHTLPEPTDAGDVLFRAVHRLFEGVHAGRRVRLLGVSVSGFGPEAQARLFRAETGRADRVRDAVEARFGDGALTRASLIPRTRRAGGRDSTR